MVYNMSELFAADRTVREVEARPEFTVFAWEGSEYPLTGENVVKLRLSHTGGRHVLLQGEGNIHLVMPCDRCAKDVLVEVPIEIDREIDANATPEERIADLDEQPYIDGYLLDLDGLVRNEIMLNLPMKVLCREDCKGVCPKCGRDLNDGACDCEQDLPDPRMAKILDLFRAGTQNS